MAHPIGVLQDAFQYAEPVGNRLIRDYVTENPEIFKRTVIQKGQEQGIHPELKSLLLHEAGLFLDKALYQYCIYKRLVASRHFGWAEVTVYYASFFALCSLTRLQGIAITRVPIDGSEISMRVASTDLIDGAFQIRRLGKPMHEALWETFVQTYEDFTHRLEEYRPVFPLGDPTGELKARNATNYRPDGYEDIYMRSRRLGLLAKEREPDVFLNPGLALGDPFLQKEVLAGLRIRLACEIVRMIAEKSAHRDQFRQLVTRRIGLLRCHSTQDRVRRRLETWVAAV